MKHRVRLTWSRTSTLTERGFASVLVDDPNNLEEIKSKMTNFEFYQFLTTEQEYKESDWSFTPIMTGQDNAPTSPSNSSEPEPA